MLNARLICCCGDFNYKKNICLRKSTVKKRNKTIHKKNNAGLILFCKNFMSLHFKLDL